MQITIRKADEILPQVTKNETGGLARGWVGRTRAEELSEKTYKMNDNAIILPLQHSSRQVQQVWSSPSCRCIEQVTEERQSYKSGVAKNWLLLEAPAGV